MVFQKTMTAFPNGQCTGTVQQHREQFDKEDFIEKLTLEVLQLPVRFKQANFRSAEEIRCVQHFPVHQPETMDKEKLDGGDLPKATSSTLGAIKK